MDPAQVYYESRAVVMQYLRELCSGMTEAWYEHNAAALIARLSHAGFSVDKVAQ